MVGHRHPTVPVGVVDDRWPVAGQRVTLGRGVGVAGRVGQIQPRVTEPSTIDKTPLARTIQVLATVIAPTGFVTALLYFFGWSHAYWFFDYFGVSSTLLGFTTSDYLMRSLDGVFVPLVVVAGAALVAMWAHVWFGPLVGRPGRWRLVLPAVGAVGGLLTAAGLAAVFTIPTPLTAWVAAPPVCLGAGVLLIAYAVHIGRTVRSSSRARLGPPWRAVCEWLVVGGLVGLSAFWATSDYAAAVGSSRARQFVAELPTAPSVLVYSSQSLSLEVPGVRESRCKDSDAAYRFRYDGLALVLQSGDQYVLLPRTWSTVNGVAVLLPRTDSIRLEFVRPGVTIPATTC
jgi:hypothetical protein